jgi:dolichol-phosphate mannosyltransferase
MTDAPPEISVVLPCYNEAGNIESMVRELRAALDPTARSYEILYVDDGSTDGSAQEIESLAEKEPAVRLVRHNRNYGQSAAFLTGFQHARGKIVVTLDADLQNDPADIPRMLQLLETADAVCGVRAKRRDTFTKRVSSRVANRVRDWLLHDGITDAGCAFRAVRCEALEQLPSFRALHRFLPTILKIHGYTVVETSTNHRPRVQGVSKYGIGNRLFVGIADIIGMRWYRRRFVPPGRVSNPK